MPTYSKIIIAIIIAAVGLYVANSIFFGLDSTEYDFRNAKWGMSPEEVKASENPELESGLGGKFLFYADTLAGYDMLISYMFAGQITTENTSLILIAGNCNVLIDDGFQRLDIDDANKIYELLTNEYGKPRNELEVEVDNGTLNTITWETKSTEIVLSLRDIRGSGSYSIDIAYLSKKYRSQLESTLDY
ncbi:MAG: hypothetical protein DHS20C13_01460 [Thermodesulfobacteriota bacterium]|nr:MAG: hypothetical protein DHS20C13_01460 [Thermodesulfobacteriota bacterium]